MILTAVPLAPAVRTRKCPISDSSLSTVFETSVMLPRLLTLDEVVPDTFYFGYCGWVRDDP